MSNEDKLEDQPICGPILLLNQIAAGNNEEQNIPPQIEHLLEQYKTIFTTLVGSPHARQVDHAIPLVPDAKIVNQRPYRLPYYQKDAMENITKGMIKGQNYER